MKLTKDEALYLYDALNIHLHERGRFMHHSTRKALRRLKRRVLKVYNSDQKTRKK